MSPGTKDISSINQAIKSIAARLSEVRTVAIFTHMRPDPDAIGSQVAAALALRHGGVTPTLVDLSPVPPMFEFLYPQSDPLERIQLTQEDSRFPSREFDALLILDTCTKTQLERAWPYLQSRQEKILVLDHHRTRDPISNWIIADVTAAACVEMVADLIDAMGVPFDRDIATALLAGLVADTGWFRFDSVTPRSLRLAARLLDAGAAPSLIYQRLAQTESPGKLALIQCALTHLTWLAENRLAMMQLSQADFIASKAESYQTDGLTDYPMMVSTAIVCALLSEAPDGIIRVNLRSKSDIDVSVIAAEFGGGGHIRAAGCRLPGPLAAASNILAKRIIQALPH